MLCQINAQRKRNLRNPRFDFICPDTLSTSTIRLTDSSRPSVLNRRSLAACLYLCNSGFTPICLLPDPFVHLSRNGHVPHVTFVIPLLDWVPSFDFLVSFVPKCQSLARYTDVLVSLRWTLLNLENQESKVFFCWCTYIQSCILVYKLHSDSFDF
jgi:hypothetical protein